MSATSTRDSTPTAIDYDVLWQSTTSTLASLASLRLSRLRIKTLSGAQVIVGGFGDVEQAELRRSLFGSNPVIALKKLRPAGDRKQRMRVIASLARELHVWSMLDHPNILVLEGFYFDESSLKTAWIATLWQTNGNIKTYLAARRPSQEARLKLASDTAKGLAYLHELSPSVCHGDIKMENILIDDAGNARLCDFGLAKVLEDVPSGLTTTQTAGYTLRYAAPELTRNDGTSHTLPSDVWAWGCLLLGITTDAIPYSFEKSDRAVLRAIMDKTPPADVATLDLPEFINWLLQNSWKSNPEGRPPMSRCAEVLDLQYSGPPLPHYFLRAPDTVPNRYKTTEKGSYIVHDPESSTYAVMSLEARCYGSRSPSPSLSPQGRYLLANYYGDKIHIYDVESSSREELYAFNLLVARSSPGEGDGDFGVASLCLNFDETQLAVGLKNGLIQIRDLTGRSWRRTWTAHEWAILSLTFADSDAILATSTQYDFRLWDARTGTCIHTFEGCLGHAVVGSPRHPDVVVPSEHGAVIVSCGAGLGSFTTIQPKCELAAFTPDGSSFITDENGDTDELTVRRIGLTYNPDTSITVYQNVPATLLCGPETRIGSLSVSSDGALAVLGSRTTDDLFVWDLEVHQPIAKIGRLDSDYTILDVKFRPRSTAAKGRIVILYESHWSSYYIQMVKYRIWS